MPAASRDAHLAQLVERRIFFVRAQKVILDVDRAVLYRVQTKDLNKAVRRNVDRFPRDFMFQLTHAEVARLRFQTGTSSSGAGWGGRRYLPYAFTEQGVAMLSSVLRSKRAIQVNIAIMRAFVWLRALLATHKELARKLDELERKYDKRFSIVFVAIRKLMMRAGAPRPRIGF